MKIKVCGLKYPDNIYDVTDLAPDYVGFIYYGRSPRFVGDIAADTLSNVPSSIIKTAVFVDESESEINRLINELGFNAICFRNFTEKSGIKKIVRIRSNHFHFQLTYRSFLFLCSNGTRKTGENFAFRSG